MCIRDRSSHTVDRIAQGLIKAEGGLSGADLLTFYCAGRRLHLGADARAELMALHEKTGAGRLVGALSLGEKMCIRDSHVPDLTLTQQLTELIASKPVTSTDLEHAALLTLDTMANALAGRATEPGAILLRWAGESLDLSLIHI